VASNAPLAPARGPVAKLNVCVIRPVPVVTGITVSVTLDELSALNTTLVEGNGPVILYVRLIVPEVLRNVSEGFGVAPELPSYKFVERILLGSLSSGNDCSIPLEIFNRN
jgi:hypothetical protein